MASGIYMIVNRHNGKRYIGSAVDFDRRFAKHCRELSKRIHHSRILQNAWNLYGESAFDFVPMLICGRDSLLMFEQRALDAYEPEYNVCLVVGSRLGVKMTDEHKAKIGAANKGRRFPPLSEERKRSISQQQKGKPHGPMSDETKARVSASRKGKYTGHRPAHVGAKIAAALKGRRPSDKTIEAAVRFNTGRKLSPEHVAKVASSNRGKKRDAYKKHSPEANARKSAMMLACGRSPQNPAGNRQIEASDGE